MKTHMERRHFSQPALTLTAAAAAAAPVGEAAAARQVSGGGEPSPTPPIHPRNRARSGRNGAFSGVVCSAREGCSAAAHARASAAEHQRQPIGERMGQGRWAVEAAAGKRGG